MSSFDGQVAEGPRAPIPPTLARTKRPMLFLAEADVGVRAFFPPPPLLNLLSILSDHLNSAALYRIIARHVFCFDTRH